VSEVDPATRRIVVTGTLLAVSLYTIDTTILNVALPHIQGSLQASQEQILWVLTSYIVMSAVMLPLSGFLALRYGDRPVLLASVAGFTVMSMLCGVATSLEQLVIFRALQGIAGAALIAISMSAMLAVYPRDQAPRAIALWGTGTMLGPIIGPSLGGFITESADWRWVFYVNVPVGAFAWVCLTSAVPRSASAPNRHFDLKGYVLLALALLFIQLTLDRGAHLGWFDSLEILVECGLGVILAYMFVVHSLTSAHPFFEPAIFRDRNLVIALLTQMLVYPVLIVPGALLPQFMQHVQQFSVTDTGLVLGPRGLGLAVAMIASGKTIERIDARWLLAAGLTILLATCWHLAYIYDDFGAWRYVAVTTLQGFGMGTVFSSANALAFTTLRHELRTEATVVLTLGRAIGGAVFLSLLGVVLTRSVTNNHARLVEMLTPFTSGIAPFNATVGLPAIAQFEAELSRQATMIGYGNAFAVLAVLAAAPLLILPLFRLPCRRSSD
jgi:DHA2 family multidrug resistance protein